MSASIRIRTPYRATFLGWVIYHLWDIDQCTFLCRSVPIEQVKNTQTVVHTDGVERYMNKRRLEAACGIRFIGDNRIFLTNGHHRLYAAKKQGRKTFRVVIWDLPIRLEWAMKEYDRKVNRHQ